jgi:hypothetical protein
MNRRGYGKLPITAKEIPRQKHAVSERPLTNIKPWLRGALAKAYRKVEKDWDRVEAAATAAQWATGRLTKICRQKGKK